MFINNKYKKWYDSIIKKAQQRKNLTGYSEKHHIIPKSLGGNNLNENLIYLTAREHFICHILLTKFCTGEYKYKMLYAANMMKMVSSNQERYINSRLYETVKKEFGVMHSNRMTGRKLTDEHKAKISKAGKGRVCSKQSIEKGRKARTGLKRTIEQKERMSLAQKNKKQKTLEEKVLISAKISKNRKGKGTQPKTEDHKRKLSKIFKGKKTGPRSEETKQKMRKPKSEAHKKAISLGRIAKFAKQK